MQTDPRTLGSRRGSPRSRRSAPDSGPRVPRRPIVGASASVMIASRVHRRIAYGPIVTQPGGRAAAAGRSACAGLASPRGAAIRSKAGEQGHRELGRGRGRGTGARAGGRSARCRGTSRPRRPGRPRSRRRPPSGPSRPMPRKKRATPSGIISGEAEVDQVRQRPRDAGAEHQADDRQGVGRLVDDRGQEDPPGRRADAAVTPRPQSVGRHGAGQGHAAGQRVRRQAERRRPPVQRRPLGPGPRPPGRLGDRPGPPSGPGRGRARADASGRAPSGSAGASWWWNAKNRSRKNRASSPTAAQRSVPAEPSRTASGNMWKNAAPSIAPAEKLR